MKTNLKTFPRRSKYANKWADALEAELREKLGWLEPEEQEHLEPFIKEILGDA